ncbi:MAG: hypothetical protein H7X71_07535, partial [Chitinophagales bacterium]|nr:hypothetical protein [Chitinophagales bacterium]
MKQNLLFLFYFFLTIQLSAQDAIEQELISHVTYLADDKLEGRLTGSKGEQIAARYIAKEFMEIGLIARGGEKNYLQEFSFTAGKELGKNNSISAGDNITG